MGSQDSWSGTDLNMVSTHSNFFGSGNIYGNLWYDLDMIFNDFDLSNQSNLSLFVEASPLGKVEDAKLLISVHQEYLPVYQDMDEAGDFSRDRFLQKKMIKKRAAWLMSTGTAAFPQYTSIYIESTLNLHQETYIKTYIKTYINLWQEQTSIQKSFDELDGRAPRSPFRCACGAMATAHNGPCQVLPIPKAKERKAELRRSQNCG